jgi:hypothetical protein
VQNNLGAPNHLRDALKTIDDEVRNIPGNPPEVACLDRERPVEESIDGLIVYDTAV